MIGQRLSIDEINGQFDGQWVLLDEPEYAEDGELRGGTLLFHSLDRDALYERALELRPKRSAIEFVGDLRSDLVYVL